MRKSGFITVGRKGREASGEVEDAAVTPAAHTVATSSSVPAKTPQQAYRVSRKILILTQQN